MFLKTLQQWWFLFALLGGAAFLLAHSSGAGVIQQADRTGSPLSMSTCTMCHGGGSFGTEPQLRFLQNGIEVDQYTPGETYTVELSGSYTTNPAGIAFQLVALSTDDDEFIGSYGTPPMGTRVTTLGTVEYWEQSRGLPVEPISIEWTAPDASEADNVAFYYVLNALNFNGGTSGDEAVAGSLEINAMSTSTDDITSCVNSYKAYPNPANIGEEVKLTTLDGCETDDVEALLFDAQGRLVTRLKDQQRIQTGEMSAGMYFMDVRAGGERHTQPLLLVD